MNKISIKLSEIFYLGFLVVLFFAKGIGLYDGQPIFKVVLIVALACYGAKMMMTAYSFRELLIVFALLVTGSVTYLVSGEKGALIYILMITGMKNVALERIFRISLVVWAVSFGGIFLLTVTNIIGDSYVKVHDKFGLGHLIRYSLGQPHPNVLHISYMVLVMIAIYILGSRFNFKWFILMMVGNAYVFLYSISSTGVVSVTFLLILNLYLKYRRRINPLEKLVIYVFFPLCLLYTFLLPLILDGPLFGVLNKFVNTRIELAWHFLTSYPFSFFGTRLSEITTSSITMDNSFLFAYVIYGGIAFSLIVIAYFLLIRRLVKEEKKVELAIVSASILAGIVEPFLFNLSFKNVSLFFFGDMILKNKAKKEFGFLPEKIRNKELIITDFSPVIRQIVADIIKLFKRYWLRLCLISGVVAFIAMLSIFYFTPRPDAVMAPRIISDWSGEWIEGDAWEIWQRLVLLPDIATAEAENILVAGYIDAETEMMTFTGNIIKLELLRKMITIGMLAGMISLIIMLGFLKRKTTYMDI